MVTFHMTNKYALKKMMPKGKQTFQLNFQGNFYSYNGKDEFVSFGSMIRISLEISNMMQKQNQFAIKSTQLCEEEQLGEFNECLDALIKCDGNMSKARELILRNHGLMDSYNKFK